MTVLELKMICKKYNIKQGKKKEIIIENIYQRSKIFNKEYSKLENMTNMIENGSFVDPEPLHNLYRDWFNLVDLANKRWYSVEEHHARQSWKSKMVLALLRIATMNAWVYSMTKIPQTWLDWRESLFIQLMQFNQF